MAELCPSLCLLLVSLSDGSVGGVFLPPNKSKGILVVLVNLPLGSLGQNSMDLDFLLITYCLKLIIYPKEHPKLWKNSLWCMCEFLPLILLFFHPLGV